MATATKKRTPSKKKVQVEDTHVVAVLDRSGSMASCLMSTIEGFNAFVNEQRELKDGGKAFMTLFQFDDQFELWDDEHTPVEEFKYLDLTRFIPRGWTALNDAIGKSIVLTDQWVKDNNWTGRVLFLIVTDGGENASKEFQGPEGLAKIATMIEDHEKNAGWNFAFMGANIDAFAVASSYNINQGSTRQYNSDPVGSLSNFMVMSSSTSSYRSSGDRGVAASAAFFDPNDANASATDTSTSKKIETKLDKKRLKGT